MQGRLTAGGIIVVDMYRENQFTVVCVCYFFVFDITDISDRVLSYYRVITIDHKRRS